MKTVFVIHAHWNNRGDEAAVRSLIDQLLKEKNVLVYLQILAQNVSQFPYSDDRIKLIPAYPRFRQLPELIIGYLTRGRVLFTIEGKEFFKALLQSSMVIHAPGGPSLGDIYSVSEILYLFRFMTLIHLKKRFIFYAPSMGPFHNKIRNVIRRYIIKKADKVILREAISQQYLTELLPEKESIVTLDAAFQQRIDINSNNELLMQDHALASIFSSRKHVIGITITDLLWHPTLHDEGQAEKIKDVFKRIIQYLIERDSIVIFIPQLFGEANDYNLMKSFEITGCYTLSDQYDAEFQQFIIGKCYALIGMRYHSNIFAAKMKIPFISIAYEQKMSGFMRKVNLSKYMLLLESFSYEMLKDKYILLEKSYTEYKQYLEKIGPELVSESYKSTEILLEELQ